MRNVHNLDGYKTTSNPINGSFLLLQAPSPPRHPRPLQQKGLRQLRHGEQGQPGAVRGAAAAEEGPVQPLRQDNIWDESLRRRLDQEFLGVDSMVRKNSS